MSYRSLHIRFWNNFVGLLTEQLPIYFILNTLPWVTLSSCSLSGNPFSPLSVGGHSLTAPPHLQHLTSDVRLSAHRAFIPSLTVACPHAIVSRRDMQRSSNPSFFFPEKPHQKSPSQRATMKVSVYLFEFDTEPCSIKWNVFKVSWMKKAGNSS